MWFVDLKDWGQKVGVCPCKASKDKHLNVKRTTVGLCVNLLAPVKTDSNKNGSLDVFLNMLLWIFLMMEDLH